MAKLRALLTLGNGKLGSSIHHFDLPAVSTCPGRSPVCESVCYATTGRFCGDKLRARLRWGLRQSRRTDFANRMVGEIRRKGALVVRVHVSGDFYDAAYAEKWLSVFRRCPAQTFYFYTRSWRVPEVAVVLAQMAARDNVRVWFSADADTGLPADLPAGVRVAWLQADEDDPPGGDLMFRVRELRDRPSARVALPVICPTDTPSGRLQQVNCGSCGRCWQE